MQISFSAQRLAWEVPYENAQQLVPELRRVGAELTAAMLDGADYPVATEDESGRQLALFREAVLAWSTKQDVVPNWARQVLCDAPRPGIRAPVPLTFEQTERKLRGMYAGLRRDFLRSHGPSTR